MIARLSPIRIGQEPGLWLRRKAFTSIESSNEA